jgi:GT2 family glycosyltransferase
VSLVRCLQALARQQFPGGTFEVIAVDDGNFLPEGFESRGLAGLDLKIVRSPRSGAAAARNRGARHASGKYLAFVDDDCEPDPHWLHALEQQLSDQPAALIGGRVVNALAGNKWSAASQLLVDFLYAHYTDRGQPRFFCSDNVALSREAFRKLAGFDESFSLLPAEDRDFCSRWAHAGGQRSYARDAIVYHSHALTPRKFCAQHFRYGRGAFHFRRRTESEGRGKVRLEPLRFYGQLLQYPFLAGDGGTMTRLETTLLFAFAQLLTVVGFFFQGWMSLVRLEREPEAEVED